MFTKGYLTTSMPILKDSCDGRHSEFSASPMIPLISHAYLFTDRAGTRRGHHVARPASHAEVGNAEIHICSYLAWRPSLNFMDPGQFPDTKDWVDEFGSAGTKEGGPVAHCLQLPRPAPSRRKNVLPRACQDPGFNRIYTSQSFIIKHH